MSASTQRSIDALMQHLRGLDIRLWLEGERLRFSAPPGALTPELQAELKERKAEVLAFLQDAAQATRGAAETIPPRPRDEAPPLSSSQQRLWFLEQLEGPSGAYTMPAALRLTGVLDAQALARALTAIVRRHDVLRTRYAMDGGRPVQHVLPDAAVSMEQVDLEPLPSEARLPEVHRRAAEEARAPFDLSRDLPLRARLLRLDAREHVLLLTLHHIASDGWSLGVLMRELAAHYQALTSGADVALPPLSLQYADYAHWQRRRADEGAMKAHVEWWRERLSGAPALLELPTDRPRPAAQRFLGATRRFTVPAALTGQLKQRARDAEATLFMTLLTAFGVLLSRYSGQRDVVVGTPIANRPASTEALIGLFANTLPLRVSLEGDPTFSALLREVRRDTLTAYSHQEVPLEQLVEALQPARDLSHPPLFQVLLTLQNTPPAALTLPGLSLELLVVESGTSQFDLSLSLTETHEGLAAELNYNTDLFDDATAARLVDHFQCLLEHAAEAPERAVSHLPLLREPERETLLQAWNDTRRALPSPCTVHGLVEAQAARRPEAVAVRFGSESLTYAALDTRANRVANHLRHLGIGPGQRVGLFLERGLDLMAGLLGILKSGAAYVPLDPMYPAPRLMHILEDSGVAALITEPALASLIPDWRGRAVRLSETTGASSNPVEAPARGADLAYVLYTSGSTGRPKGVAVPHEAAVNFLASMGREPGMTERDTLLAVTTVAFDISVLELFLPLSVGGCVFIASQEEAMDGTRLLPLMTSSGATMMQATPSTWRMLLSLGWSSPPTLKLLCGGEALPPELLAPLRARCSELWNMYGPTETTVWSTVSRLESGDTITLGQPIANTQAHVLDAWLQPVPPGVVGTLFLGGGGVARGYLNRPDLTAEQFVPDPHSHHPGARLYRTGDLARRRPDGSLEFLGRGDGQVKVRGHRIELGDIEARLAQHPGVAETAVRPWGPASDPMLVAYVRPRPGVTLDDAALREHLRAQLPAYMLPASFVVLESFPRTANNKLDRKALPPPDVGARTAAAFVAPRTPNEQRLADIWREVLAVERVSLDDDFFSLGGHSMKAVQALARIQEAWRVEITLRVLFEHPTLGAMARHLEAASPAPSRPAPPPLVARPRQARRVQADSRADLNLPDSSTQSD
ncbi:non-ribosomal peptide synthetase [Myxococcus stipitatus DSM 14675]|uniref:Non-ribosomal peptide synthetase n=1 Tax=Myxococcus stipitatus (strain DSM 14675 / JCM 12634 / Mx s8) TaxID=1278073 RepID=L7U6C6_MYXSD|nr:non-ribosomal peptide synthetase [Myxococcus stipitatus]AGC43405.1 non-ribosomal peptide synthetase [Myxococcus stipitatus DSM 14675]